MINEDSVHAADTADVSSFVQQRVVDLCWRHVTEPVAAEDLQHQLHLSETQGRRVRLPGLLRRPVPCALHLAVTPDLSPVPVRADVQAERFTGSADADTVCETAGLFIKIFNHLFSSLLRDSSCKSVKAFP